MVQVKIEEDENYISFFQDRYVSRFQRISGLTIGYGWKRSILRD